MFLRFINIFIFFSYLLSAFLNFLTSPILVSSILLYYPIWFALPCASYTLILLGSPAFCAIPSSILPYSDLLFSYPCFFYSSLFSGLVSSSLHQLHVWSFSVLLLSVLFLLLFFPTLIALLLSLFLLFFSIFRFGLLFLAQFTVTTC